MQQPTVKRLRIRSTHDAHILFHAVSLNLLQAITRRLDSDERRALTSGNVYVWEERSASTEVTGLGIERFTEGRRWGPSRVRDEFLFYYEKKESLKGLSMSENTGRGWDPLVKQTYSVWVEGPSGRRKWHLTGYFTQSTVDQLYTIDDMPELRGLSVPIGIYRSTRAGKMKAASALVGVGVGGDVRVPHHPQTHTTGTSSNGMSGYARGEQNDMEERDDRRRRSSHSHPHSYAPYPQPLQRLYNHPQRDSSNSNSTSFSDIPPPPPIGYSYPYGQRSYAPFPTPLTNSPALNTYSYPPPATMTTTTSDSRLHRSPTSTFTLPHPSSSAYSAPYHQQQQQQQQYLPPLASTSSSSVSAYSFSPYHQQQHQHHQQQQQQSYTSPTMRYNHISHAGYQMQQQTHAYSPHLYTPLGGNRQREEEEERVVLPPIRGRWDGDEVASTSRSTSTSDTSRENSNTRGKEAGFDSESSSSGSSSECSSTLSPGGLSFGVSRGGSGSLMTSPATSYDEVEERESEKDKVDASYSYSGVERGSGSGYGYGNGHGTSLSSVTRVKYKHGHGHGQGEQSDLRTLELELRRSNFDDDDEEEEVIDSRRFEYNGDGGSVRRESGVESRRMYAFDYDSGRSISSNGTGTGGASGARTELIIR